MVLPRVSSKDGAPRFRGCGHHAQVVVVSRIYALIIPTRNSAYKERARLLHAFDDFHTYHVTVTRATFVFPRRSHDDALLR